MWAHLFLGLPVLLGLLHDDPIDEPSLHAYAVESEGRLAMGVYMFGSKVGWMIAEHQVEERDGEPVLVMRNEMFMRMAFDDEMDESSDRSESVYALTGEGDLIGYRQDEDDNGTLTRTLAELDGDELVIVREFAGRREERQAPKTADTLREQWRLEQWLSEERSEGDVFESVTVSFSKDEIDQPISMTWRGRKTVSWAGVATPILMVRAKLPDMPIPADAEVLENGTLCRLTVGGLVEIRLEDEAVARQLDLSVDMMAATAVPVDRELGDPEAIETLVLRVAGLEDFDVPVSARQRVEHGEEGTILRLGRSDLRDRDPLGDDERGQHLAQSGRYNTGDDAIVALVAEILSDVEGTIPRATTLAAWVAETLEDSYARNAETAVQILENAAGDCTEHACLFVTLARAAGIPCREVGGVAYGGSRQFAWHAWAEVHDGERWVSVDPTWNQLPVDPTHIKLASHEDDNGWIAVLGLLDFHVEDITLESSED